MKFKPKFKFNFQNSHKLLWSKIIRQRDLVSYSSFNKRSEPESEDPWSCVVQLPVAEGRVSSLQRPRSGDINRKESSLSHQRSLDSRQQQQQQSETQLSAPRQESSRQTSEDMSWEFTINEAPIARLESLDELDQDHGS